MLNSYRDFDQIWERPYIYMFIRSKVNKIDNDKELNGKQILRKDYMEGKGDNNKCNSNSQKVYIHTVQK